MNLQDMMIDRTYVVLRERRRLSQPIFHHGIEDTLENTIAGSFQISKTGKVFMRLCSE